MKREVARRRKLFEEIELQSKTIADLREQIAALPQNDKYMDNVGELTSRIDECESRQAALQTFLYSKHDLAIICLVLCTCQILASSEESVKAIHVARYDGVLKRATSLLQHELDVGNEACENDDEVVMGTISQANALTNLTCEVCGREIVNLHFYSANNADPNIPVFCPKHIEYCAKEKRVKAFMLMYTNELRAEFDNAAKEVKKWKTNKK